MSVEWFTKLKEIDSLSKSKNLQLKTKKEQEERLSKLQNKKTEAESNLLNLKQTLIAKNTDIADLEKKLKNAAEQKQRLLDIGGDEKKVAEFAKQIEAFEEEGLLKLEEIETVEAEMKDSKTFIDGIEKTIQEIKSEIDVELEKIHQEISNADLRINLLLEELPSDFRLLLTKVSAKNLAHGPFTRIEQGSCYFCRFKISRIEESEIDMQKGLKLCPQCGRIFLPYGA